MGPRLSPGGIQTHPGIDENGVLAMAAPRTNRPSLLTLTGPGLRIRGQRVRIPPGAPILGLDSRTCTAFHRHEVRRIVWAESLDPALGGRWSQMPAI